MKREDEHVTITTKESRQGDTSGHVRAVLIAGLVLAIAGLFGMLVLWSQG